MTRRANRLAAFAAATTTTALLGLPLLPATPAAAATTITVTTTTDTIDGGDGLLSLREAVDLANTTNGDTTIVLTAATYQLTICGLGGAGLVANSQGDLNPARADAGVYAVTIQGNGATIDQTCPETRHIQDLRPGPVASLTLEDLTLTGGETTYNEADGPTGFSSSIMSTAGLILDGVQIIGAVNLYEGPETVGPNAAAVVLDGSGPLTVVDSTISGTVGGAAVLDLRSTGSASIAGSTIASNDGNLGTAAISVLDRPLIITSSAITDNHVPATTIPEAPPVDTDVGEVEGEAGAVRTTHLTMSDTFVARNAGRYGGGVYADIATITDSRFEQNVSWNGGGLLIGRGTVERTTFLHNVGGLGGGAIVIAPCQLAACPATPTTVLDSTFVGNLAERGGGIHFGESPVFFGPGLEIRRSTFTGNRADVGSAIGLTEIFSPVTIDSSSLSGNLPGLPLRDSFPNASFATSQWSPPALPPAIRPNITVRNTVIHSDVEDMTDCLWESGVPASGGHNFDSDGTCGLSDPSDVSAGGDPMLGALADNGGVTETMVPLPGSPLLDAVPAASAGCVGETSQNALALPQGLGCEIGAAEVPSSARLAGHVTSAYTGLPLAGIEVRVRSLANTNAATTTTGADGTWTVAGLAAGDYKVLFRDPTGEHNQTFNGSAWPFSAAPAVNVTADHTTVADQSLTVDNAITGTVTDTQTGLPVAGVQVRVRTADNTYIRTATTNAAGTYTIADLAPGDYKLLFRDPTGAHEQTFNGSAWPFSAAPTITVTDDTVTNDQAMVPVPAIDGTVTQDGTGTPLAGIEIRVRTLANTYLGSTTTAPDGTWTIHLPAGTYKLLYTDPTGTHQTEWHDNKPGFATATPITHTPTGETLTASLTPAP